MPILARDGDHVGMPRKHYATRTVRPDRGVKVGIATLFRVIDGRLNTSLSEEIRYEIDQLDVWRAADGFKSHQPS